MRPTTHLPIPKTFKTLLIKRVFPFATIVVDTVGHLELQISPRIFEKIEMTLLVLSEAWGKMIHEKIPKREIWWHRPFNVALG